MSTAAIAVRERGLLMSGPMVRATLGGRKTKTRRVAKPQPERGAAISDPQDGYGFLVEKWPKQDRVFLNFGRAERMHCPYGVVGDRLWVRETHAILDMRSDVTDFATAREPRGEWPASVSYFADDSQRLVEHVDPRDWRAGFDNDHVITRPSIHMPRWASRLTLEITDVRVERVQDISAEDCEAEGIRIPADPTTGNLLLELGSKYAPARYLTRETLRDPLALYRAHFASAWDALNAKRGYGWDLNPYVWVIGYRQLAAA